MTQSLSAISIEESGLVHERLVFTDVRKTSIFQQNDQKRLVPKCPLKRGFRVLLFCTMNVFTAYIERASPFHLA